MSRTKVMRVLVTVRPAQPDAELMPMGPAEAVQILERSPFVLRAMRMFPRVGRPVDIDPGTVFGVAGLAEWMAWAANPQPDDKIVLPTVDGTVFEAEVSEIRDVGVSVDLT
jgi:hypothetical protein